MIWSSPPASPLHDFVAETWRQHVEDGIYACFVVAMPIAIGLLVTARHDLSARIVELAASRGREQRLLAIAIRADERAKIAREMHDVVSHQVSLIAMQAGALQVSTDDELSRQTAATIRVLSTRTLDELRNLVGALRTATDGADEPDLDDAAGPGEGQHDGRQAGHGPGRQEAARTGGQRRVPDRAGGADQRAQARRGRARPPCGSTWPTANCGSAWTTSHPVTERDATTQNVDVLPSGGHGLVGLRERATLLGGDFYAGPTERGGFTVLASLPLPPE